MKYHTSPTDKVHELREEDFLVSKTNLKGIITYCNKIFIEFSQYSEVELLGSQHNIVRHPDMPRAVFNLLWDTIAKKQEIFAYVKNMSKDGGAYWVFANVTASLDEQGSIIGYYSVRRKPKASGLKAVTELYREMIEIEKRVGTKDGISASTEYLLGILSKGGMSYEKFVLSL
jgi:PAS domain S-box-containing protein